MRPRSFDLPTIGGVAAGGIGLVAALVYLRFCGAVSVPAKPPPPKKIDATPEHVAKQLDRSSDVYTQAIARDALRAGVAAATLADMERAFAWTADEQRRTLRPGDPPLEVAGLRLTAIVTRIDGSEDLLGLVIENPGSAPVAYDVETDVTSGADCRNRTLIPHNGTVIAAGGRETRSECGWKRGMELYVNRVESAAIPPLGGFYLSLVPPQALGESDRVGAGHRPTLPAGISACNVSMAQSVMRAIEDGRTHWRDLADFYVRHPCTDYEFPDGYHAFTRDNERSLPVVGD